ncbi:hypothetical protein Nepgr_017959 [Nepenthes gracilis]|uniref:Uncharacterized protein n=1 Tax=Nepenthes gracilis TaxID=150966 RepID=A0AAD3SRH0_NEPGR|nr:hypothetical protein Nepgr_017959 [Nepenthes gracilis]
MPPGHRKSQRPPCISGRCCVRHRQLNRGLQFAITGAGGSRSAIAGEAGTSTQFRTTHFLDRIKRKNVNRETGGLDVAAALQSLYIFGIEMCLVYGQLLRTCTLECVLQLDTDAQWFGVADAAGCLVASLELLMELDFGLLPLLFWVNNLLYGSGWGCAAVVRDAMLMPAESDERQLLCCFLFFMDLMPTAIVGTAHPTSLVLSSCHRPSLPTSSLPASHGPSGEPMFALSSDTFPPLPVSQSAHITYQLLLNDKRRRLSVRSEGALHKDILSNFKGLADSMCATRTVDESSLPAAVAFDALSPSNGKVEWLRSSQMVGDLSIPNAGSVEHPVKCGANNPMMKEAAVSHSPKNPLGVKPANTVAMNPSNCVTIPPIVLQIKLALESASAHAGAQHLSIGDAQNADASCAVSRVKKLQYPQTALQWLYQIRSKAVGNGMQPTAIPIPQFKISKNPPSQQEAVVSIEQYAADDATGQQITMAKKFTSKEDYDAATDATAGHNTTAHMES